MTVSNQFFWKFYSAFQRGLSIHQQRYQRMLQSVDPHRQRNLSVHCLRWSTSTKSFGNFFLKICRSAFASSDPACLLWSFACLHVKRSIVAFVLSLLSHLQNWKKSAFLYQIASEFRNDFFDFCNQFVLLWFCIPSLTCVIAFFAFFLNALVVLRSLSSKWTLVFKVCKLPSSEVVWN